MVDVIERSVAELRKVSFSYPNGTEAIRDVSLRIPSGRVIGICGPSGCGKSSLLSILAGSRSPTSGELAWSPDANPTKPRHPISMVFQKDTLLPWLTVERNAQLFQRFNRSSKSANADLIDSLISLVGLQDVRSLYPYQLSGGMRRRLAFIAAMAAQPRLLLLDEPFSALDEPTRIAIHQDVLNIIRRLGTTVVLVTHDLAEATSFCDQVVILSRGPGKIAATHDVPFGNSRDVFDLRETPEFLKLYGQLWHDLNVEIKREDGDER